MIKAEIFASPGLNIGNLESTLEQAGVSSFATTDVRLYGNDGKVVEHYRGVERVTGHSSKIKLEVILPEHNMPLLLSALKASLGAESDQIKVFTTPMNDLLEVM